MIAIISETKEADVIEEFFELFKTPWEFYAQGNRYSVIICNNAEIPVDETGLIIVFGNRQTPSDTSTELIANEPNGGRLLEADGVLFPVYGKIASFQTRGDHIISACETGEAVGYQFIRGKQKILRIGFDLFNEVSYLLINGQPTAYAHIPTLEIHITNLRNWILKAEIQLIEIPPSPAGRKYFVCPTHDVDFAGIRHHLLDPTFFGFVYRALIGSLTNFFKARTSSQKLITNWAAVFNLPLVYLGLKPDFWAQFDHYKDIEKGKKSTFFFLPQKNYAGQKGNKSAPRERASRYDVADLKKEIQTLQSNGNEIALHGIDSWMDTQRGIEESKKIHATTAKPVAGVRIHWLYFSKDAPQILEKAGFLYDSTIGYNDTIGFKAGTTQVYRPLSTDRILELSLNVQDTALFASRRMNLPEDKAWQSTMDIKKALSRYGGVLTINWHHRSFAPERLWGDFYRNLLDNLEEDGTCFATAQEIVEWFQKRRGAVFEKVEFQKDRVRVVINSEAGPGPALVLKVYPPECVKKKKGNSTCNAVEVSFSGKLKRDIMFS